MSEMFNRLKPIYWVLYLLEMFRPMKVSYVNGIKISYAYASRSEYFSRSNELQKEPDTIRWIDGLEGVTHFLDIGACVGTYGIYFGKKNPTAELAFVEPFGLNYRSLIKNLFLNDLNSRALTFNAALSKEQVIFIKPSSSVPGSSMHENIRIDDLTNLTVAMQKTACITFDDICDKLVNLTRIDRDM